MFLSAVSATLVARISFNGFNIANISTIRKHPEFLETRFCILANDNTLSCVDFLSRWSAEARLSGSLQPVYYRADVGLFQVEFELNIVILGTVSLQVLHLPIPIIIPPIKSSPGQPTCYNHLISYSTPHLYPVTRIHMYIRQHFSFHFILNTQAIGFFLCLYSGPYTV